MRKVVIISGVFWLLFLTGPVHATPTVTSISGSLSKAENTCVSPIQFFQFTHFQLCSYSGGIDIQTVVTSAPSLDFHNWMGPVDSGGFYSKGYLQSPNTDGGYSGSTLGDGKVNLPFTGLITIEDFGTPQGDDDRISGTLVFGPGERGVSTLNGNAVEQWDSLTHTIPVTTVSSVTANAMGGYDYVIGSQGFPLLLTSAAGDFPSESASIATDSPVPPDFNAWEVSGGGNITLPTYQAPPLGGFVPHSVEIVSYATGAAGNSNVEPNIGVATTVVVENLTCVSGDADSTPDMTNPSPPDLPTLIDDCNPDPAIGTGSTWAVSGAEFDNLILKVSTNAYGQVVEAEAFYVLEYKIASLNLNAGKPGSWVGGTLSFTGTLDADGDGVEDGIDNCIETANADQRDTDFDGFGNLCDGDFNGNNVVDPADFSLLKSRFGQPGFPDQDLNGNGIVDPFDFSLLKSKFGQPPGPSGLVP